MKTPKQKNTMNYFDIQNNFLTVSSYSNDVEEIIEALCNFIDTQDCEHLNIDISVLNVIDAVKVGAMCSTSHFIKYPFGSLQWIVKDIETRNSLKMFSLKTVTTTVKRPIIADFYTTREQKVVALR